MVLQCKTTGPRVTSETPALQDGHLRYDWKESVYADLMAAWKHIEMYSVPPTHIPCISNNYEYTIMCIYQVTRTKEIELAGFQGFS